jgi:hypothetical protein
MKNKIIVGIFCIFLSHASFATLIGDTVECSSIPSGPGGINCSTATAVVGAGQEFSIDAIAPGLLIDIGAASIQLAGDTPTNWFAGDSFTLSGLDWVGFPTGFITDVILSGVSGITGGFDQSDISFTGHSITVDLSSTNWDSSSSALLSITADHGTVPEPATLALMGLGLAAIGYRRHRSRKAA